MRRIPTVLAVLCALASAPAAIAKPHVEAHAAADGTPVMLAETRPLETALGDPTLPSAQSVWLEMIGSARASLDLEEFYLSERRGGPLTPVLGALADAARRGVRVRLLLDAGMHRTYPLPADSLGTIPGVSVRV